jgi:catechol 2,3-dioxygenase-like lactoylglutathione lyase family enzyme
MLPDGKYPNGRVDPGESYRYPQQHMTHPSAVSLCGAATVFVVQDVLRSVEHYRDVLGFHTEFTYGQPTFYAGVERDGVVIQLQAASETKRQPGHGAVNVLVTDVDALYRELKSRGARTLNEPADYPYGMRDFDIHGLDGNQLCFDVAQPPPTA